MHWAVGLWNSGCCGPKGKLQSRSLGWFPQEKLHPGLQYCPLSLKPQQAGPRGKFRPPTSPGRRQSLPCALHCPPLNPVRVSSGPASKALAEPLATLPRPLSFIPLSCSSPIRLFTPQSINLLQSYAHPPTLRLGGPSPSFPRPRTCMGSQ